jgi:hypothetical protein
MFRTRERGMSYWPFVVTLLAFFVMTYMWYEASKSQDQDRSTIRQLQSDVQTQKDKAFQLDQALQLVGEKTGYANERNEPDPEKLAAGVKEMLDTLRGVMVLKFNTAKFSPTGAGGKLEEVGQGEYVVNYLPPANEIPAELKWQDVGPIVAAAAQRMAADIENHVNLKSAAEQARTAAEEANAQALAAKDTTIADFQRQIQAVQASMAEQGSELRDQIATLESQLDSARSETEEVRNEADTRIAELSNKVSQAEGEITRLVDREAPFLTEGPDGEVLASGAGLVIVNRGKADMLMPGTVFSVFKRLKGGGLEQIGTIKATVVDDDTARCSILESSDVIAEGDLIQSNTYSPNRQLHFYLLGEFQKMGVSQATQRLEQLGAKVDDQVTTLTHYLVLGTPGPGGDALEATDAYMKAKAYGIKIITEAQLASFTQY